MRMLSLALAPLLLAGCVIVAVDHEDEVDPRMPIGGAKTCNAAEYQYLVGKRDDQINRSRLPASFRIVCADCMVTQDFSPNRLNIQLGPDNRVSGVRCG